MSAAADHGQPESARPDQPERGRSGRAGPERDDYDYDVVVVGSGFGGSVAALRLVEKGYRVLVLEAGRRFADHELPATSWDLRSFLWAPALGWFGIQRVHRLRHAVILAGAGVGGGSLNYANTLYVPPKAFFDNVAWAHLADWAEELAPHYDQASRMLGVVTNPCNGPVEQIMADAAAELGVAHTFARTPVGVLFSATPGEAVADPYFGGAGPARRSCTQCGSCMTGCRVGAKNTLVKNYLALAESAGVEIRSLRMVVDVRPLSEHGSQAVEEGYQVTHRRTGPIWQRRQTQTLRTRFVVLAAGAWGTQTLLQRCRQEGALPMLSPRLGALTRTNSEALLGATVPRVPPGLDASRGLAITRSFHVDADTHVENCRYGRGSNAMGLLATILVDGSDPTGSAAQGHGPARAAGSRWRAALRQLAREPGAFWRSVDVRRWSERTIIALVMQTRDNSLTVTGRRRWWGGVRLVSEQGHGEPNPSWIPAGHAAARVLSRLLGERTGQRGDPGGTLGDLVDMPMTAHYLGGVAMGADPAEGVIDPYHRLYGYPGISVVDGSSVSANLGVNPSLTITAQAERALALWPNVGERDPRPPQSAPYRRLERVWPRTPVVPAGAPGELGRAEQRENRRR